MRNFVSTGGDDDEEQGHYLWKYQIKSFCAPILRLAVQIAIYLPNGENDSPID